VLGHQLVAVEGVVGQREPPHSLGPGGQDVDVVVDHQGDLDGVDRLQRDHAGSLSQSARPPARRFPCCSKRR
jgi:hypothetical protein